MTIPTTPGRLLAIRLLITGVCVLAAAAPAAAAEPGAGSAAGLTAAPVAAPAAVSAAAFAGESAVAPGAVVESRRLAQATSQRPGKRTARPAPVPQACTSLTGVERRICVECDGIQMFKRIGCQQRVFWTACKGKRLFQDPYCRTHQDQGPPAGEGG